MFVVEALVQTDIAVNPDLIGVPSAVWALAVSLLGFFIAVGTLGWQIGKHFLDGGRVKVYLNPAIWVPEVSLSTNRSGRLRLQSDKFARAVTRGRALELAQLVVENPGRAAVTIYSPGLSISGHGRRNHSLVPRMFATEESFGADAAVTATVVRLEPYSRVTFLLDYWSVVPGIMEETSKGRLFLRGFVGVAGRTKRPQRSSRRLRWRIQRDDFTAIEGSPDFTPVAVLWRELFVRLPARDDAAEGDHDSDRPVSRGIARSLLDEAMSGFNERPAREDLEKALDDVAMRRGYESPSLGTLMYEGYEALDRMEGHLTPWTEGLFRWNYASRRAEEHSQKGC